jgi:hypothetical protein
MVIRPKLVACVDGADNKFCLSLTAIHMSIINMKLKNGINFTKEIII